MASGGPSALPRRLQKSNSLRRDDAKSPLEILQQMGFSKHRSAKAIAATGVQGVHIASDWLLSHINDPHLDDVTPRQYILYISPLGDLQRQLMEFWEKSLATCGWNGAHTYLPHITLTPFFSVDDSKAEAVKEAFERLALTVQSGPGPVKLDYFSQENYIGLFMQDNYLKFLSDLVSQFSKDVERHGIDVEFTKKQLHVSLAYQYVGDKYNELTKLAKDIDVNTPCNWEIRMYSRDPRVGVSEVRKVIKEYKANLEDELDLIMGDYVFMDLNESARSEDGWYQGTSWVTGQMGMYPGTYTQRTAETRTWALHCNIPLGTGGASPSGASSGPLSPTVPSRCVPNGVTPGSKEDMEVYEELWNPEVLYAKVNKKQTPPEETKPVSSPRQLTVVRHGERMDFVFGRVWVDQCFSDEGVYTPTDLNMPRTVPKRSNHLDYCKDAPLTAMGSMQAFLVGQALRDAGVVFDHVYVSPALRCVQTATGILKSLGQSPVLHIEYGLFEWLGWYQLGLPKWFTPAEMKEHGFNVDVTYKPYVANAKLDLEEDIAGYYKRSGATSKHIIKKHEKDGGNIMILGHAGSLEVCTRQVLGRAPRTSPEFREICPKVPYCGMLVCQEDPSSKKWSPITSPILPLSHGHNKQIVVKDLLYPIT